MLLKRLELNGFKSFAKKTTLEFPAGVTAVVGPNGSGKSNIIDAIRWLLGEREAKHLRGSQTQDLIFGGTEGKTRLGLATAALFFDNTSKFFPLEFEEVEIRREVSRDGSSAYFINKSEVRLKDLIELLSQSRLGTKGIIVITQGNSDLFIKASPSERRDMIEEILGLREFRLKRQEAERKLKNTNFNIEKVEALIEEILPHLKLLRRQAAKWEKREEVERELKEREDKYFANRVGVIESAFFGVDPLIADIKHKVGIIEKELRERENNLKKLESREPADRARFNEVRRGKDDLVNKRQIVERREQEARWKLERIRQESAKEEVPMGQLLSFAKEIYREAQDLLKGTWQEERVGGFLQKLVGRGEEWFGKKREEDKERLTEKEAGELENEIKDINKKIGELNKEEAELSMRLEKFTAEFKTAWQEVEKAKAEISKLNSEKERGVLEKEKWRIRMDDLKDNMRQAGRSWEEFVNKNKEDLSEEELNDLEKKIFKLRGELAALGEVDEQLVKEARETEERYQFLSNQLTDLKEATMDLKSVIEELTEKIHSDFREALKSINDEFSKFFTLMFAGGKAQLSLEKMVVEEASEASLREDTTASEAGVMVTVAIPKKKISSLDVLSGGERSLVSIAALFALISVSPPPFLVLDEIDAPLDEKNAARFAEMLKEFSSEAQFVVVTHNRATMEIANALYGITIGDDGASKVVSLKMG